MKPNISRSHRLRWILFRSSFAGITHTITAQAGRRQVEPIQSIVLVAGRGGRVELAVWVDVRVDGFVARGHRLGEDGVHVAIGGGGLEHGGPVEVTGLAGLLAGHHGRALLWVLDHWRFSLFKKMTVNIIPLSGRSIRRTGLDEVRALLVSSHPGRFLVSLRMGERVVIVTVVHPVDRGHGKSQRLLLRGGGSAVHGRIAKSRTHKAVGRWDGVTDFFLYGLGGIGGRLGPLQVCLRMREMARPSRVSSA